MLQTYKNIILTTHAYNRAKARDLALHSIYETVNYSDKNYQKSKETKKYIKTINDRKYHVVATYKKDQKKYLVISAWIRGEKDKQSLIWQLIVLPFKVLLWLLKKLLVWIFKI